MLSKLRNLAAFSALSLLSGCAFTQWTDHAFLGTKDCPPTHPGRQWAFATIAPIAALGDLLTAPVQQWMLVAGDDDSLYTRSSCIPESEHQAMLNSMH